MKYKVTYKYEAKATVEVEADSEKEAKDNGMAEADEIAANNMNLADVKVERL